MALTTNELLALLIKEIRELRLAIPALIPPVVPYEFPGLWPTPPVWTC